ncbi:hypothetical protein V6N13_091328 [Hibiscus sabdariffa]
MQRVRLRLSVTSLVHYMFRSSRRGSSILTRRRISDDSNIQSFEKIAWPPDFTQDLVLISLEILQVPEGGPKVTFNKNESIRERVDKGENFQFQQRSHFGTQSQS